MAKQGTVQETPKPFHKNPRTITEKQHNLLQLTLKELGDLSGVIHDLNSNEIIGGNQRSRIFDLSKAIIKIEHSYKEPTDTGTVAVGYIMYEGERFAYRQVPVVVIDKDINDRMASTIRHNRARGKHSIGGMSSMVFSMLEKGWKDEDICNELGMDAEELLKLKHITGFSKLFANTEYKNAWETKRQILLRLKYEKENA